MIDKVDFKECTLCESCANACRVDAITFSDTHFDFGYPLIDKKRCIGCNACERACPVLQESQTYPEAQQSFAAKSKTDSVRKHSSSGGIFYELAVQVLSNGGFVCGAVFDENFHVRHIVTSNHSDLLKMMGSKYAQSHIGLTYRTVKEKLLEQKTVLFTGCPCQVAGLLTFLGKSYDNLITVDVACHCVPSDRLLQTYISIRQKQYGAKLKELSFRNKEFGWHNFSVHMRFSNGDEYSRQYKNDNYMQAFLSDTVAKSSCYNCRFKNFSSGSDITIGDLWGAEKIESVNDDDLGLSCVIVNSSKGMSLLNSTFTEFKNIELSKIIEHNNYIISSCRPSQIRDEFYQYAKEHSLSSAFKKYFFESRLKKLYKKIRYIFAVGAYKARMALKKLFSSAKSSS